MSEEEKSDVEYTFHIERVVDGTYRLQPGDPAPPTLDDVYNACASVQRNISAQQNAAAVHNLMLQAAANVRTAQQQTKSGLYVPNDVQVKEN